MKTLSLSPNSSAEGDFSRASGSSPEIQAEDFYSAEQARIDREANATITGVALAAFLAGIAVILFPVEACVVLLALIVIGGGYLWTTHRGDAEIGVSDTQGRDGGAT
jgi:hypothetical protein